MNISRFVREVCNASYYRTRPFEVARFAYAKWLLSRYRLSDPFEFLRTLDINVPAALEGFERWRPALEGALQKIRDTVGLQGGISLEDGIILYCLTREIQPEIVIETGVAAGMSTSFIGAALIENGHGKLYSIELPEANWTIQQSDGQHFAWPQLGVGWAIPASIKAGIRSRHSLILEDVKVALPRLLAELPALDMFFHDDLHVPTHMRWEYDLVWPRLRDGGVLVSDDADFGWVGFCRGNGFADTSLHNIQRLTAVRKACAALPTAAAALSRA